MIRLEIVIAIDRLFECDMILKVSLSITLPPAPITSYVTLYVACFRQQPKTEAYILQKALTLYSHDGELSIDVFFQIVVEGCRGQVQLAERELVRPFLLLRPVIL